jgi:hypothetical protein
MDWELALKILPAVTALIGAFAGATIGPLIARKAALDAAKAKFNFDRELAREAAVREDLVAERERRRALLDPLLAATRQQWREAEDNLYSTGSGKDAPVPSLSSLLVADLRWEAIQSKRFKAALFQVRVAQGNLSNALPHARDLDPPDLPAHVVGSEYEFEQAVLRLHDAADEYIGDRDSGAQLSLAAEDA